MLGGIDEYGSMTGLLGEVANGMCDIGMNSRSFTMMWHLRYFIIIFKIYFKVFKRLISLVHLFGPSFIIIVVKLR